MDQMRGTIRSFISISVESMCVKYSLTSGTVKKCSITYRVVFPVFTCNSSGRRKREIQTITPTVVLDNIPEVLNNVNESRATTDELKDRFSLPNLLDSSLDLLTTNSIQLVGAENITSSTICVQGNTLNAQETCDPCAIGTHFNSSTDLCEDCPAGTYQNQSAQMMCIMCPGLSTSFSGASACISKCAAEANYCQNGGSCDELSPSEIVCQCPSNYAGDLCQTRRDKSDVGNMTEILGGAIGGGGAFLLLILIIIGCIMCARKKDKQKYQHAMKSNQSYTSEYGPFQTMPTYGMKPQPHNAYDNFDMDFYRSQPALLPSVYRGYGDSFEQDNMYTVNTDRA